MNLKRKSLIAVLLVIAALLIGAVAYVRATSGVVHMGWPMSAIPDGNTHYGYYADSVDAGGRYIDLQSGAWDVNMPPSVCAVSARLTYKANSGVHMATLSPYPGGARGVTARQAHSGQWADGEGIVPVTDDGLYLDVTANGTVYIEINGYWECEEYYTPRPTLEP